MGCARCDAEQAGEVPASEVALWEQVVGHLGALLRVVQYGEAQKTPDGWIPTSVSLPVNASAPARVVPHRATRFQLDIYNDSNVAVVLGADSFDVTNAQNYAAQRANASQQWSLFFLDAGQSLSIRARAALYALNVGNATATLQISETVYLSAPPDLRAAAGIPVRK